MATVTLENKAEETTLDTLLQAVEPEFHRALVELGLSDNDQEIDISNIDLLSTERYSALEQKFRKDPQQFINNLQDSFLYWWLSDIALSQIPQEKRRVIKEYDLSGNTVGIRIAAPEYLFSINWFETNDQQNGVYYVFESSHIKMKGGIVTPPKNNFMIALSQYDSELWNYVVAFSYLNAINMKAFALGYADDDIITIGKHNEFGLPTKLRFDRSKLKQRVPSDEEVSKTVAIVSYEYEH